jgi:hypothetical protein
MSVRVRISSHQEAFVIQLDGVADDSVLRGLADCLRPVVDEGRSVIVDVSELEIGDRKVAHEFLVRLAEIDRESDVRLVCRPERARETLRRADRSALVPVFDSLGEALPVRRHR